MKLNEISYRIWKFLMKIGGNKIKCKYYYKCKTKIPFFHWLVQKECEPCFIKYWRD